MLLVFDRNSYDLKQWMFTDAQGLNTSVVRSSVHNGLDML